MNIKAKMLAHPHKPKHTFIYRVPETDYFVGAGFYVMSPGVYY